MTGTSLFALSVAIYAGIPLLLAIRRTPFQLLMLYTHIAAVLTMGGLLGAVFALPVWGGVTLLAGQVSYGGFMFATLITVIVGRDVRVVRNIVVLTINVNVMVFLIFKVTHLALSGGRVPNPFGVDAAVFDQSLVVVLLGGLLIILELLGLLAVLEAAKRRLGGWAMSAVYVLAFVAVLTLDGVLFPTVVLHPSSGLGGFIASSVPAKLVLAAAYAVPLVLFLAFYPRLVQRYQATPLDLGQLVPGRRAVVARRLQEKQTELEVRTAEAGRATATVSRILDAATNTLLVATDPEFRVTHFNAGAEMMLGYAEAEVVGRPMANYGRSEQLEQRAEQLGVPARLSDVVPVLAREGARRDWVVRTKSGEDKVLSLSFTEIRDADRLIGYLCAGEDVTDRMRTEEALTEALHREYEAVGKLEEADRVKDAVVSTISHELRTPIASIRGYGELLADGDFGALNSDQAEALGKLLRNTGRLTSLVDDLLHLDRAESGRLSLTRVSTDLAEVVRDAWDGLTQLARGRDLDLRLRVSAKPVLVLGDPHALERVVLNLGDNALKFTPDGGTVTVAVDSRKGHGVVTVADDGIGIAPDEQQRILERFFRSPQAYHHAIPGTGLGLAVVDAIITEHEGTLKVSSTPGAGTTVTVTIPLCSSDPDFPS